MMSLVRANQLSKEWKGKLIFGGVDLEVYEGERLALFGANGVGKTTLLQLLKGETEPDEGTIERGLPLEQWGYMRQNSEKYNELTAMEAATADHEVLWRMKLRMRQLEQDMGKPAASEREAAFILDEYSLLMESYERTGGYEWPAQLEKCLIKLQISPELWDIPYNQLSGGQKTRVMLASLLARRPRLLLLDEPTNHLDESSLSWLENWLCNYEGTVLFVSHDRTFLDQVATGICELKADGLIRYKGGYSDYRLEKERELREQAALYKRQRQAREALEQSIRRYQEWFNKAERAAVNQEIRITVSFYKAKATKNISRYHAKQKELERLEKESVQKPKEAPKVRMKMKAEDFQAKTLVRMENISFGYSEHEQLIEGLQLSLNRGHRLAVRGENGSGKTTLLKLLMGHLTPNEGKVWHHPQLVIGYFSQELEGLDHDMTLLDSLLLLPEMTETHARTILGCFLFSREDVYKKIGNLSMGEKCRAAFIQLYFSGAHLLVLDEPTNYLDVTTREVIEDALMSYPGALVVVSHDRTLVEKLANVLLTLTGEGPPVLFEGTVGEEKESYTRQRELGTIDPALQNAKIELEWQLAKLMNEVDEEENSDSSARISEIRRLKKLLEQIN